METKSMCRAVRGIGGGVNVLKPSAVILALFSVFPSLSWSAGGETEEVTLGGVFVSTTKSSSRLEDSPRAISVVSKEELHSHGTSGGIQEALGALPGVEFARSGGLGGQIIMRGFNSNTQRSMLAIDGDRFRGRSTLELNLVDPFVVERIDVIRGPASSIWGADAMNGVVNVITRRAKVGHDEPFRLEAKVRGVEYNSVNRMRAGRAEVIGGGKGFDVLVGVTSRKADDYRTPKGTAENSRYESQGVDFRVGYSPTAKTRFEVAGRYQDVTTGRAGGLGAAPGLPYFRISEAPIKEKYLKLGVESRETGAWADVVEGSFYVRKLETDIYQDNATNAAGGLSPTTTHMHIKVHTPTVFGGRLNATKALGDHKLAYGVDFFNEDFKSRKLQVSQTNTATGAITWPAGTRCPPVTGPTLWPAGSWCLMERGTEQTNIGLHVSDDWQATQKLTLSGALRFDYIKTVIDRDPVPGEPLATSQAIDAAGRKRVDRPVTGSLGSVWKFAPEWSAVAHISQGFLAPSGNARSTTSSAGSILTIPAPGLKPEHSTVYEAGIRHDGRNTRFGLTAFHSRYKDLIVLVPVTPALSQRMNVGSAEINGIEFDGEWRVSKPWLIRGMLSVTRGTNKTDGKPLEAIPPLS
ncbi:MAG: TonB-dependent receptor, partial [Candidatus Accumulibacter sp.]|nr:TonB-dependent receptor [Accumulibacter sp.]